MLKVAILGGSGYTGAELFRLLQQHREVEVTVITSERFSGQRVSDVFLNIRDKTLRFEPLRLEALIHRAELFFLCLPHKTSQEIVAGLNKAGKRVIDLSADYRLKSAGVYRRWYNTGHRFPDLLKKAVYGLPEVNRERIRNASIVANPGCYPTGAILGLAPIIDRDIIDTDSIIIDSKSGVSGAGRSPALPFMFSEVNESVRAYAITTHRHIPEIEQELSLISGKKIKVIFTPHLIPMDRGILTTIYVRLRRKITYSEIRKLFMKHYHDEPFVRILEDGQYPSTKGVRDSNYCDISVFIDKRGDHHTLIIVNAIDNLMKGASGQAVQNMNIMYSFDETEGLMDNPPFP
jgi:N-acetyl-gamma-glutamyl-phosphate reductase